jgi:Type II secretion system protein C
MTAARLCSVLFLLASAGLGLLVAWEVTAPPPAPSGVTPVRSADVKAVRAEKIELPRRRPPQDFAAITERPVFSQSRRPAAAAPDSRATRRTLDGLILMGTVIGRDRRSALLRVPDSQTLQTVFEGQEVAGWTLEKVLPDRVVLSSNGDSMEVSIWKDRPPAPAPEEPVRQRGKQLPPQKPAEKKGN